MNEVKEDWVKQCIVDTMVELTGDHPHAGSRAIVRRHQSSILGIRPVVELQRSDMLDGSEWFVMYKSQLKVQRG